MGRVNGHVGQHSSGDLVDDDAHTEYAESDVMLGGNGTSSSNGSASANGVNNSHRYWPRARSKLCVGTQSNVVNVQALILFTIAEI